MCTPAAHDGFLAETLSTVVDVVLLCVLGHYLGTLLAEGHECACGLRPVYRGASCQPGLVWYPTPDTSRCETIGILASFAVTTRSSARFCSVQWWTKSENQVTDRLRKTSVLGRSRCTGIATPLSLGGWFISVHTSGHCTWIHKCRRLSWSVLLQRVDRPHMAVECVCWRIRLVIVSIICVRLLIMLTYGPRLVVVVWCTRGPLCQGTVVLKESPWGCVPHRLPSVKGPRLLLIPNARAIRVCVVTIHTADGWHEIGFIHCVDDIACVMRHFADDAFL